VKAGELLGLGFALVVGWTAQGFPVGVSLRNHSTDSTDYAIVMSGAVDMELDGTVVHLKAGDVRFNAARFTIG
jgi:mannose-6-phosphate isomerase-like protein (cupin superfamily)